MPQDRKFEITDAKGGAAFAVRVVTRSEATELAGTQDDGTLRVRLKAQSAGGAANEELIGFLASKLGVSADKIEIVVGQDSPHKLVSVEDLTTADVESRLGLSSGG